MPNRILKESICSSDTIEKLTWFEEVFFYRLIVNCDDYGRMDARAAILRSKLFPLKTVTDKQIGDALNKLRTAGIAYVYEYDGKTYLQLRSWNCHQQIRNHKSKYPDPQALADNCNHPISSDINCNQLQSNDYNCTRNPIQSEYNPNSSSGGERFAEFWQEYPRKTAKQDARKAWDKLKPDDVLFLQIMDVLRLAKGSADWTRSNGQFIPHPASWLNGRRWEDEIEPPITEINMKGYIQC